MDNLPTTPEENALSLLGGMPSVEAVRELEVFLLDLPQVDIVTTHVINNGMCARTIFIPAGVMATGALSRIDTINVFIGDISVVTNDGTRRLTGYNVLPGSAGFKRAGITHADTWWTTVWPTTLTDIDEIMAEYTAESEHLLSERQSKMIAADHADFALLMDELHITPEFMAAMVEHTADLVPMPEGFDKLRMLPSSIHGNGMFATTDVAAGELLAPMRISSMRTPAGRYINHSPNPNARVLMLPGGDDIEARACRVINSGEEVTIDYRQALAVNQPLKEMLECQE